jgi:hypothetical protein
MTALFRYASTLVSMRGGYYADMTKPPVPLRPAPPQSGGESLVRAAWATFAASCKGSNAGDEVTTRFRDDEGALVLATRATVAPGSTQTSGWASHIVRTSTAAFLSDLGGASAVSSLIAMGNRPVSIPGGSSEIPLYFPQRSTGPAARGWVSENAPIPASAANLEAKTLIVGKLAVIVVGNRELVRQANGERMFRTILTEDAGLSLDAAYLGDDAATADSSAGLLDGVASLATTGELLTDLQVLAMAVGANGSGKVAFITSPGRAAALSLRADISATILPSIAVADDRIVAVDPMGLVHGFGVEPDIQASSEATVHMSDTPLPIRDGTTADPVTSLYQQDRVALRMILDCGFVKRRTNSVAFMDSLYAW